MKPTVRLKKIRWGIIGLGAQANNIARSIIGSKNGVLFAVAGKSPRRAKQFAEKYGAAHSGAIRGLLNNSQVDAVFIASPSYEHAKHVLLASAAKKHILCEKPLALSVKDGRRIASAVKKNRVRLAVGFHLRHHPDIQKTKALISSGKLGIISLIQAQWCVGRPGAAKLPPLPAHMKWRENFKKSGGGAVIARGTHLFDLISYLTGKEPISVSALTDGGKKSKIDTTAVGILEYKKFFATIITSRIIPRLDDSIGIYGNKGHIELRGVMAPNGKKNLWQMEIEDFGDAILRKKTMKSASLKDGLMNVAVTEAFVKSAYTGKKTKIKTIF